MSRRGFSSAASVQFPQRVWAEEVEQLAERSTARVQAEKARRMIERGRADLRWKVCQEEGGRRTRLPECVKLYVPLEREDAGAAPFGFVFRLTFVEQTLVCRMVAFGERHPTNPDAHSVYERAHRRLHGRYP